MTDDLPALCERLRVFADPRYSSELGSGVRTCCSQAASALERLSAELEQAKRERDEALAAIDAVATRGPGMTLVEAVKGVLGILAGTETELAEAESALAQMREERDNGRLELEAERHSHRKDNKYLLSERDRLTAQYNELIMAVGNKWPEETRHQTALRYIRQAETPSTEQAKQALGLTGGSHAEADPCQKER